MRNDSTCLIWEKTEIIDLPFLPLQTDKEILESVIGEAAKRIKYIRNGKFRMDGGTRSFNERFFFYKTDTLLGVDISTLDTSCCSYFDALYMVLKMYPMVFINSYVDNVETTALHSYCLEHRYILPVFSQIPFLDKANSKKYADLKIELLIKENKKISLAENITKELDIDIKAFEDRFPQFSISDEKIVTFNPRITWLGVQDTGIENLLNQLFNENISQFNISEKCKEFSIDIEVFKQYVNESMLFYSQDGEICIFRLLRKNIYWGFVCNLANQFEQELIERNAIYYDFTVEHQIGTEKHICETVYHKIGNLFVKKDAYSYKLFCHLKRLIEKDPESRVLIVDNGNMDEIESRLISMDLDERVFKILDYFGEVVQFPTIDYKKLREKNVIIVIDVINTGRLIKNVINLVEEIGCKDITIFSYIVNENFKLESISKKDNIKWWYLTEKELCDVRVILSNEYEERFKNDIELNFKMLWGTIDSGITLDKSNNEIFYYLREKDIKEKSIYDFLLKKSIGKYSYIYQKLKRILNEFSLVLIDESYKDLYQLIHDINSNEFMSSITIETINEKDIKTSTSKKDNNQVALLIMPLNYVEENIRYIREYMEVKNIKKWKVLRLVNCELYCLEEDKIIDEEDNFTAIFYSKLRRYLALSDNPQLNV